MVLVVGCLWGWVIGRAEYGNWPRSFQAPGVSAWIAPPGAGSAGFFRYEFALSEAPRNAWALVQASEILTVYCNGKAVFRRKAHSTPIAAMLDLTPYLRPGQNTLALYTEAISEGMRARVALVGEVVDGAGRRRRLATGGDWRVITVEGRQRAGVLRWHHPAFDASGWARARVVGQTSAGILPALQMDPAHYTSGLRGRWVWQREGTGDTVYLRQSVDLPAQPRSATLRVSTRSHYTLMVNGMRVAEVTPPDLGIHIYSAKQYFEPGRNWIALAVEPGHPHRGVILDALIESPSGELRVIGTDRTWQASRSPSPQWADGRDDPSWAPALELAADQFRVEVASPRKRPAISVAAPVLVRLALRTVLVVMGTGFAAVLLWFLLSGSLSVLTRRPFLEALAPESLAMVGSLLPLAIAALLSYDIRYPIDLLYQDQWRWWALTGVLAAQPVMVIESRLRAHGWNAAGLLKKRSRRLVGGALLAASVLLFCGLRLQWQLPDLSAPPMITAEINGMRAAQSIRREGRPILYGRQVRRELVTYEASYYPVAASQVLFGETPYSTRAPAVLFGLAAIAMTAWMGWRMFGLATGLLAAGALTIAPWAFVWATRAKYPSQLIFLVLLVVYLVWEALGRERLRPGFVYAAGAVMAVAYFTWQGSLLLLAALLAGSLVLSWGRFPLWRSNAVWTTAIVLGAVIALHLWRRVAMTAPQLVMGTGLSTEIGLVFMKTTFDPWVYVYKFLAAEAHVCLLAAGLLGVAFCWRDRAFRFLLTVLLTHTAVSTTFLYPNLPRYLTGEVAIYVLVGAAGLIGTIRAGLRLAETREWMPRLHWLAAGGVSIAILILGSWTQITPIYRLTHVRERFPRLTARERLPRGPDVRRLADYALPRLRTADAIIGVSPVPVKYYFGRCDYFIQSTQQTQVHLTDSGKGLGYIHKVTGSSLVRNVDELREVMRRHGRVWIVAASKGRFQALCSPELLQFVERNYRDVQHSVRGRLLLWEGYQPPAATPEAARTLVEEGQGGQGSS